MEFIIQLGIVCLVWGVLALYVRQPYLTGNSSLFEDLLPRFLKSPPSWDAPPLVDSDASWASLASGSMQNDNWFHSPVARMEDNFSTFTSYPSSMDSFGNYYNGHSINPANGLPMVGAVDVEGNPYGTDFHHDYMSHGSMFDSSISGFSDSFH